MKEATEEFTNDLSEYMKLQAEELADSFELVYQINQAAIGKYGELIQEADALKDKSKVLNEQEFGIASFLGNLAVIEGDITRLEETVSKLESYCTLLESKVQNA